MGRPTSSAFDALQAHFKRGLQESPSHHSQAQPDKGGDDDGDDNNEDVDHFPLTSRASPPSSYLDPLILADDGLHGRLSSRQQTDPLGNDGPARTSTTRRNPVSILPKITPADKAQNILSAATWNNKIDIMQKRRAEDDLIDPRLSKTPRYDTGSTSTGGAQEQLDQHGITADFVLDTHLTSGAPTYTYPAPSESSPVPSSNARSFDYGPDSVSQNTIGTHEPFLTSTVDADGHLMDSATDALLERQLDLQAASDEDSESDNRQQRPSRYNRDENEPRRGRRARGRGRGGGRGGVKRGPRKAAEPTGDVKYRLNMASNAYVNGRLDEAIRWVEDAIRINAETYRAWTLLTSFFEEKGDLKKSFTARVFACNLQPKNVDGWLNCAEIAIELRDQLPQDAAEFLEQASLCYSAALRADINHQQARYSRAAIAFEKNQFRTAAKDYLYLLEHGGEYDVHALRAYAEVTIILANSGKRGFYEPSSAVDWYARAFSHFQANDLDVSHPFEWQDISIFSGLLAYIEHTKDALVELKSLARWLLGRSEEAFWDDWQDDDREWDIDSLRRIGFEDFQYGKYPESSYGNGIPLDLRTKMAVYRLKLGDMDEAQLHIDHLDPESPSGIQALSNEPHLLAEVGSALYESDLRSNALRFFEPLLGIPEILDSAALLATGRCYLDTGDKRQAEECFTAAIDVDESNDEAAIDARFELAQMYEAAREEQEAYILVNEAIRLQQAYDEAEGDEEDRAEFQGSDDDARNRSRKARPRNQHGPRRLKPRVSKPAVLDKDGNVIRRPRPRRKVFGRSEEVTLEEKRRAEELAAAWRVVHETRSPADNDSGIGPSDTFMRAAKELVDDFRSCKGFYSWEKYLIHLGIDEDKQVYASANRNLIEMKERLSHNLNPYGPNAERQLGERTAVSYRAVPFSQWLDLFLEYAVSLAHYERFQEAYQVCESARDAEVFNKNREDMFLIHVTWASCALRARDEETCVAAARFLMRDRQFDTDPFRMFAALCRLCPSPASWYASGPVQKYMLRQIKLMDRALVSGGGEDSEEEEAKASNGRVYSSKELDVTLLVLYGHILFVSNSFTYALNYFLRAYSVDPTNHMILLSVGQCYIHYALKRQSENRQYLLIQGFVFLHRYYDLKASSAEAAERQEAHYNMARSYHAVGIPHLAAEFYQRVLRDTLDDSEPSVLGNNDLSREAAYNLQQICWAGGDLQAVKSLGERYLIL
ncbi:hypothetical protein F5Y03DRAFT_344639 [Xylaria venustula]|nr:hypothetical protein F5Y03DRAFT_344639 [Xylaria venustula]